MASSNQVITPASIARDIIARTGAASGYLLAAQWVASRYSELASMTNFRHLRKVGQLYLPAPITNGTVTVTLNSNQVIGDATANAQWHNTEGAPESLIGQWFRVQSGTVWSRIVEVDVSTNVNSWIIYLETPYAADNQGFGIFANGTVVSSLAYYIVPRFVELASDARTIGTVVLDAMFRPLELKTEEELDMMYASRFLVAFPPWCYAIVGSALDSTFQPKLVEFYPYPQTSATVHYIYWSHPLFLTMNDPIPPTIDPDILRTGAMADAYNYEASRVIRLGQVEAAAYFRNVSNQEETRFQSKVSRAIRNDRGADDVSFLVKTGRWKRGTADYDPVQTAYGNFLARGY